MVDLLPLGLLLGAAFVIGARLPAWAHMWLLAVAFYFGFKWLAWKHAVRASHRQTSYHAVLAFLFAWPGMDPRPFLNPAAGAGVDHARRCSQSELVLIALKIVAGVVLLFAVARMAFKEWPLLAGWLGMTGTVLILHFGLFHGLACFWQSRGISVERLMQNPAASRSIGEFWSARWNRAFPDLVQPLLVRPLARKVGPVAAILAAFLLSGVVHDVVISWPVRCGFGGPTMYFVIQGVALVAERAAFRRWQALRRSIWPRATALIVVIAPVGLLFHRAFVIDVYAPFMHAIGAL